MKSENKLTREFIEILHHSENPVPDLHKRFIKLAVEAGVELGEDGYQAVVDSLRTAMDDSFDNTNNVNKFDYLNPRDGSFQWRE